MKSSRVWQIVEQWLDVVPFPPNQSKIAEHIGVTRSAVSDWKSGKTRPAPEHLRALGQMMAPQLGPDVHVRLSVALLEDMGYPVDLGVKGVLKVVLDDTAKAAFSTEGVEPEHFQEGVEILLQHWGETGPRKHQGGDGHDHDDERRPGAAPMNPPNSGPDDDNPIRRLPTMGSRERKVSQVAKEAARDERGDRDRDR
ncbi:helix-turn-helix domain-containing protein [Nocardioides sp.]|uniref:helix-turn-helix domain-containing protein n=1 Tax=Nocardioides sp. TaxID=35761 RepID=UPI0035174BEA